MDKEKIRKLLENVKRNGTFHESENLSSIYGVKFVVNPYLTEDTIVATLNGKAVGVIKIERGE